MSQLINKTILVNDIHSDIYGRITSHNNPIKIIIIPGNPGIIDLYQIFIDTLFFELNEEYSVIGISNAGHSPIKLNNDRLFDVEDQIEHKINFLRSINKGEYPDISLNNGDNEFILMGHSIGAYLSLKLMSRAPDIKVRKCIGLMPTICHLKKGFSLFNKIATLPYIRNILAIYAHYMPRMASFISSKLGFDVGFSEILGNVIRNKVDYYTVLNIATMGYIEARDIHEIDDELKDILNDTNKDILFYYSTIDPYTPFEYIDEVRNNYKNVNIEYAPPEVEHAFVIKHSKFIAEEIVKLNDELFQK